jgi:hypothetical protein
MMLDMHCLGAYRSVRRSWWLGGPSRAGEIVIGGGLVLGGGSEVTDDAGAHLLIVLDPHCQTSCRLL